MCGVAGACTHSPEFSAAHITSEALFDLQHRGDAATGISAMTYGGKFDGHSDEGLVLQVHTPDKLKRIAGQTAIGQDLWPTDTEDPVIQPIWSEQTKFALVHNGQLSETTDLKEYLEKGHIDTKGRNDSQLVAFAIDQSIRSGKELPDAVEQIYPMLHGGFAIIAMQGNTVVAFRDPGGIRPLELAEIEDGHLVASETYAFRPGLAKYLGEVMGGEMLVMEKARLERHQLVPFVPQQDPLEPIYIADRNSQKFGRSVDHIRRRFGAQLAEQYPFKDKDYLVTPVPDTAVPIAETYANKLGLEYKSAIHRNRFIPGRSFMQRNSAAQHKVVTGKLRVVPGSVKGRDVIVIEDSFVRLTTAPEVYTMLMAEDANSVTFLSASPPVGYPDHAGVDTRKQSILPASELSIEEIRQLIGCQRLGYLSLSRMLEALDQPAENLNLSVFNGDYRYIIGHHADNIKDSVSLKYLEDAFAEVA